MALLYPRLLPSEAVNLWEERQDKSLDQLRQISSASHPSQYFAAVGGSRIDSAQLTNLATRLRELAVECGFPERKSSALRDFDTAVTVFFAENLDMPIGEALRKEAWAFVSLVLVPDLVKWRFKDFNIARCTGGRRDCFHRLWLRAQAFDLGAQAKSRWVLLQHLTEDFYVSVMERPTLAGNPALCRVIGIAWINTATRVGRGHMEDINRRTIKRIRAKATLLHIDSLEYGRLKELIADCYEAESTPA